MLTINASPFSPEQVHVALMVVRYLEKRGLAMADADAAYQAYIAEVRESIAGSNETPRAQRRNRRLKQAKKRAELATRTYHGSIVCPICGGKTLYKEPICPGCADGRQGYRLRLHCGECDFTERL